MARALWNGSISFGLVTIPVSLFAARSPQSDVQFNLLHKTDMQPVHKRADDPIRLEVMDRNTSCHFLVQDGHTGDLDASFLRIQNGLKGRALNLPIDRNHKI